MASIFSRIVSGEIPCYKVAETEDCLAFLDIAPIAKGHVLCIPKQEVDYLFDIEDELYCKLQLFAKKVAKGLKKTCPCVKVGVAVIGVDVPHAHIHLVPLQNGSELNFKNKYEMSSEELAELAQEIAKNIE